MARQRGRDDGYRWTVDLGAAALLTLLGGLVALSGVGGILRLVALAPLVLFLPGYALVSAAFPAGTPGDFEPFDADRAGIASSQWIPEGLDGVERAVIAVVASVTLVPTVTLLITLAGRRIETTWIAAGVVALTLVCLIAAFLRRARADPAVRFAPAFPGLGFRPSSPSRLGGGGGSARRYNVVLAVSLLLVVASVGFAAAVQPPPERFTELYVTDVGIGGNATGTPAFPTTLTRGETASLPVSVGNHEGDGQTYTAVALLQDTSGGNGSNAVREVDRQRLTVPADATRNATLDVTPQRSGRGYRVIVALYRGSAPENPPQDAYRTLRLPVDRIRDGSGGGN